MGDNEILIKNRYVGLCHSDLPPYLGIGCTGFNKNGYHVMLTNIPYPFELGHEPLGVVVDKGKSVTKYALGDTVSGMTYNAFADHFIVDADNAFQKVNPDPMRYPIAEPLMCIANIARIAQPEFGDTVAVIGCGYMGLLALMALRAENLKELVAIDIKDERLALAQKYGATKIINSTKEDVEDAAFRYSGGTLFDIVIEISGSLRGFDTALSVIRLADRVGHRGRGKILLPSVYGKEEKWSIRTGWNMMLKSPVMHVAHPRYAIDVIDTMRRGVEMYDKGVLKQDELITHRVPFAEISRGFEILESGDPSYIKGVIVFD